MKEPLDSRQLRAFVSLAKTGSFTRTGRELFVSQSAISHAMKVLEDDVGCRLLDRLGKTVQLTPAGEHFLHFAEKILRDMLRARESLEHLGKWGKGQLRIGAAASVCQYLLPGILRGFRAEYPDWLIRLEVTDGANAIDRLQEHQIDLAIVIAPDRAELVQAAPLFADELLFLVSPEHPWAGAGRVERESIARQHFILFSKSSHTFRLIESYWKRDRIVPRLSMELANIETIKELVKLNLGITILAPWAAQRELAEASLVAFPLGRRKLQREWVTLRLHNAKVTLAEATFLRLARTAIEQAPWRPKTATVSPAAE